MEIFAKFFQSKNSLNLFTKQGEILAKPFKWVILLVIKEIPFKCCRSKASACFIKEIPYKLQHVQDYIGFYTTNPL